MERPDTNIKMDLSPVAFWGTMKEKHKRLIEERDETSAAFEFLQGMFEWEGLPMTVRPELLELYLLTNGSASIRKDKTGEYVAMVCDFGDKPDAYGIGRKIFSRTANGEVYVEDRDSEDVAYGWNNLQKNPCVDAYRVGSYIAEIDTSLDLLVWWSRASRMFVVPDNKTKTMIEEGFAALKKGVPLTIKSENILQEIESGKKTIDPMDLTDTAFSDRLDKLTFLREKRFAWFKDRYGMCARDTAKKAQVSVDEANGDTGSSMIIPLNMLRARQEFADMISRKFGWTVEVHFGGAWLGEMERYESTVVENGDIDIDGYDAIQEGVQNAEDGTENGGKDPEPDNGADASDAGSGGSENGDDNNQSTEDRKDL